tara:strand:+ start:2880 stop:3602 length:723 start_codon:yes stop_codon:yes gene_type:complete
MTDDKALVDAYSSIYKKKEEIKEEVQQLDEALPLAIPALIKGAGLAMKALKIGRKVHQGVQVAKGLVNTMKGDKQMQTAGHEPEGEMIEDVAITHLDGTTTEVIDVIKPEPLGNPDEKLADRLWDQVAANLTTLGEMGDTRYRVSPVEELEEKKKAKKDYDGDGKVESGAKEYRGVIHNKIQQKMGKKGDGKDTSKVESFNVKSPVIFSKPEEKTEETISEEMIEKHASAISKAHKSIKK